MNRRIAKKIARNAPDPVCGHCEAPPSAREKQALKKARGKWSPFQAAKMKKPKTITFPLFATQPVDALDAKYVSEKTLHTLPGGPSADRG